MFVNATFEKHAYRFLNIKCNRVTSTIFSQIDSKFCNPADDKLTIHTSQYINHHKERFHWKKTLHSTCM